MRYFRRLPPFLRMTRVLGILFPIAGLILLIAYWQPYP